MQPPDKSDLKKRLTSEQYAVACEGCTEAPFSGKYWDCHDDGSYTCVCCDATLFDATTKFDSGTGWPSFWQAASADGVVTTPDHSHGMTRVEITCAKCGAHLGHMFADGPKPTGMRYCVNSASLDLQPRGE